MAAQDVPPPPEGFAVEEVLPPPPAGFAVEDKAEVEASAARVQWQAAFDNGANKTALMVLARKLGLPLPDSKEVDAMIARRDGRVATPNPTVVIEPGDYQIGADSMLDFSPPSPEMTNIQKRQYLKLANDPNVTREQLTAWLNGIGRTVDDSLWMAVEQARKGTPFSDVAPSSEKFKGMIDEQALAQEYAAQSDGLFAQVGRSAVEAWSDPASLMNALDRGKLDFFDVYKGELRKRFPDASPEQLNRLEDEYIGYMARMRSKAASEGVKEDSFVPWLAGQFLAVEPYDIIPVGRAAKAGTRIGRGLEKAAEGAALAVAGDVVGQGLALKAGAQDKFDYRRTAGSAILSGLIAGGVGALGRGAEAGPVIAPDAVPDFPPGAVPDAPQPVAPDAPLDMSVPQAAPVRPEPMPRAPVSPADFLANEQAMGARALAAYRDMVQRGMQADPTLGPEDFRPFSDFMAEWRDREAAAAAGNAAAGMGLGENIPRPSLPLGPMMAPPSDPLIEAANRLGRSMAPANDGAPLPPVASPDGVPEPVRPRPLMSPNTRADLLSSASRIQPRDMLPLPSNAVDETDLAAMEKGRFEKARIVHEREALTRGTVINWRGEPVPKVGPLDMVGWLRTQGGLREQGGELATIGLTNAARKGLDHVGQETRFGPLVDPEGMTLDDAALAAFEAGYFPELTERPDINTFLDALRETYNGGAGRRFLPDDAAQLEMFEAMRAERYDQEQVRFDADGPVYVDKSAPAGEDRPYPPVEAYEEWPSEAIKRVGNLDVSKLDSPQDIGRALRQSYNTLGGFDDATRGRIANAETERLAAELNMTADQLLSRRKGQAFNAEEALAARQILAKSGNELVNAARKITRLDDPGDELLAEFREKWMRHVAIQEQVAGMTAEAGRVLQQFKMVANSRAVSREVLARKEEVLSAFVRGGGGKDDLQEAATAILDAVEVGPGVFNTVTKEAAKPKFRDKIAELYINSLLSNPPTHIVNMVSNSLTMVGQVPEYALASVLGAARRAALGEKTGERILASEVGARAFGLIQGTREGAAMFARALKTGEADDFASKVEGDQYKAISGLKGEIIRIPTRLLTAEDQLFKGVARRMELNAEAVRIASREGLKGAERKARIAELVANPTDDMLERSLEYGRYLTFQSKLGAFGQGLTRITSDSFPAKVVVPFVRTPINLLKFASERSPAAPLLKEWRADFKAGGEKRDLAIARAMLGTGFATLFYQMALDGQITGAVPPDPAKAKLLYADGWQPYSIKVGDRYVSYSRLDPFSTLLGVSADMATLPQGLSDRQKDDQATMLVASIMSNLANKTWLSGVSSLVEGLSDPQRYADSWLQRTVGAFAVPAGVAGAARALDPVARKREDVIDAVQARIPGLSDNLLPRRDVFGEPVTNDSVGPDFLSPFSQSFARNDPVVAEMMRIGKGVSAPGKQFTQDGEKLDYTPEQYDRYHQIAGRLTYNRLLALIGSPQYARLDDAARRKASAKAIADARRDARAVLSDPSYPIPAKGDRAAGVSEASPARTRDASDPLSLLQANIPGVRVTSGFRDAQYQDDMRRRGYSPASNSSHLRGDGIDLLPPDGLSMKGLAVKVRQALPRAKILNEGDHLHVTIPGWGKAPVLGGADRAAVVNPALVPPPPDGFQLEN